MRHLLSRLFARLGAVRNLGAALFGAHLLAAGPRRAWFLSANAALFAAALFAPPAVSLVFVSAALFLQLCVYFAWAANEKKRGRIAKKIDNTPPDSLPDLRDLALNTALAVPCFLPLLLAKAQDCFDLFQLQSEPGPLGWLWFLLNETYLRALPDVVDLGFVHLEGLRGRAVGYYAGWPGYPGHGLVLVAWAVVYLVLLQGLLRLWQIRRDIKEGILGTFADPDMGVRLGRRAVRPLLTAWRRTDLAPEARAHVLTALGRIGDRRALPLLRDAALRHDEQQVREAALIALADAHPKDTADLLGTVLRDAGEPAWARAAAATALGRLDAPEAAGPLLEKLAELHNVQQRYRESAVVRKQVVRAVGQHLGRRREKGEKVDDLIGRAVRDLLADAHNSSLLEDVYLRVRNAAAGALAQLGDARAILPFVERLGDEQFQNPKLIQDTVLALGRLLRVQADAGADVGAGVREKALAQLSQKLRTFPNESVRQAAAQAVGICRAVELQGELMTAFKAALKAGDEEMTKALKEALGAIDPKQADALADLEKRTGRLSSQRRRQTLLDGKRELAERLQAARELGAYRDERGLKALGLVTATAGVAHELKSACEEAMRQIRGPTA